MSPAARSVNIFGIYLILLGLVLLLAPNPMLTLFGLPPTEEVWIRVVGMLVAYLGIYYRVAAASELRVFFFGSVMLRLSVPVFFLVFILAGWSDWPLLGFGVVDAAGAVWTWTALRRSGSPA
jgi:hypothetical protein